MFSIRPRSSIWNFDRMFRTMFQDMNHIDSYEPLKVDVREKDKKYLLEVEMPGMDKENINLEYRDNTLTISAERKEELKEERENYIRRERKYGSFRRSFYVENIDEENIKAKFKNGVLKIELPKLESISAKEYRIPIE